MATQADDLYEPETVASDQIVLAVKMPAELRDQWLEHCTSRGTTMSKVIRKFIERELMAAEANQKHKK